MEVSWAHARGRLVLDFVTFVVLAMSNSTILFIKFRLAIKG